MSNPFLSLHVQPSYGQRSAIVTWSVADAYKDGDFYIYKSENNGRPPWTLLNTEPASNGMYIDTSFVADNRLQKIYYRIFLKKDDEEYDSPLISFFDKLSRLQYGGVAKMMKLEYSRMMSGNGLQVLHYVPLNKGEANPNYDEETGQLLGPDCAGTTADELSFGQPFIGGFNAPIYTWMETVQRGPDILSDLETGLGADDSHIIQARLLAFPKPERGHLIIHPPTDNRYVIGEQIQGHYFRGVIPISFDVRLHLLRREDPRYKVPVPEDLSTILWATI